MRPLTVALATVDPRAIPKAADALLSAARLVVHVEASRIHVRPRGAKAGAGGSGLRWSDPVGGQAASLWSDPLAMLVELRVETGGSQIDVAMSMPRSLKPLSDRPALRTLLVRMAGRLGEAVGYDHPRAVRALERHRVLCQAMAAEAADLAEGFLPHRNPVAIQTPSPLRRSEETVLAADGIRAVVPTAAFRAILARRVPSTVRISSEPGALLLTPEIQHVSAQPLDAMGRLRLLSQLRRIGSGTLPPLAETI